MPCLATSLLNGATVEFTWVEARDEVEDLPYPQVKARHVVATKARKGQVRGMTRRMQHSRTRRHRCRTASLAGRRELAVVEEQGPSQSIASRRCMFRIPGVSVCCWAVCCCVARMPVRCLILRAKHVPVQQRHAVTRHSEARAIPASSCCHQSDGQHGGPHAQYQPKRSHGLPRAVGVPRMALSVRERGCTRGAFTRGLLVAGPNDPFFI